MSVIQSGRQQGFSALVIPLVLTIGLLLAAIGFGAWAFMGMLDYKNNTDAKIASAVDTAKRAEDKVKDAAFAEQEKSPFRTYAGPTAYGSIKVKYPKTWSAYVIDTRGSSPFVDAYFYPGSVPDAQSPNSAFALRVQLVQDSYSNVLNSISSYVRQGQTKVRPYKAPKVPSVIGSRLDGRLPGNKSGSMIILPLRNMTLKVWTEAPQFKSDFDKNILPNFTFAP